MKAGLRKEFLYACEDCFKHGNTAEGTITPVDRNWYQEYVIASALRDALKNLKMQYPGLKK
jgi:hypothetical protein